MLTSDVNSHKYDAPHQRRPSFQSLHCPTFVYAAFPFSNEQAILGDNSQLFARVRGRTFIIRHIHGVG